MHEHLPPANNQNKPIQSLEEEVFLNLQRTAGSLAERIATVLRPHGVSTIQYNVLRILRRSGRGLACSEISKRLVTKDTDITRLIDRMEARGWVSRERYARDKRVVIVKLTDDGSSILQALDADVAATPKKHLGHLGKDMLEKLNALLILARK